MRLLSRIKSAVVPKGVKPRTILFGPLAGIRVELDLANNTQLFLGLFERETHPALRELSRGIKCAIDAGAAFGEQTLFFLLKTDAEKVFAFEPEPTLRAQVWKNVALNHVPDAKDRLQLVPEFVGSGDSGFALDRLFDSIDSPCFLKLDIEGAELAALQGAVRLLRERDMRLLVETHSAELEETCCEFLVSLGYAIELIDHAPWRRILPEQRSAAHNRWFTARRSG